MKLNKLTLGIGIFILVGLVAQTFLQLKYGWGEALIFIGVVAVIYFLCAILYQNNARTISLLLIFLVGVTGVVLAIISPILFHAH